MAAKNKPGKKKAKTDKNAKKRVAKRKAAMAARSRHTRKVEAEKGTKSRTAGKAAAARPGKKTPASARAKGSGSKKQANAVKKHGTECRNMSISLDHVTKIEGHAKLHIKLTGGEVEFVKMSADVGLRDFERFLEGRPYHEAPEITERICGICSQAHTIAALAAVEKALGIRVSAQTKRLRHLILLASILQSHVLHMYFLALPEYLGFDNAIDMASKHMTELKRALRLKRLANLIVEAIGGREIHCFTPVIGGFAKLPSQDTVSMLLREVKQSKQDGTLAARLFSKLKYPDFSRKCRYVSLRLGERYNYMDGNVISSDGISFRQDAYQSNLKERVNEYSSAKELELKGEPFFVGALARLNNNYKIFSKNAKKAFSDAKLRVPLHNPFHNNLAQAIEVVHILDCLAELLTGLAIRHEEPIRPKLKEGRGAAAIEVPRGILIHDYTIGKDGLIKKANIIAPTTMNLHNIEADVAELLPAMLAAGAKEPRIVEEFEKLIRAYDPCVSCSTHFLEIEWL